MNTVSKEHLYNLNVFHPTTCVGNGYTSSQSRSSLMYPYPTSLYPVPSTGDGGLATSRGALNGLVCGTSRLPRRTGLAVSSSDATTAEHSSSQSGDYLVRTGELIASPHSLYQVLELLGEFLLGPHTETKDVDSGTGDQWTREWETRDVDSGMGD